MIQNWDPIEEKVGGRKNASECELGTEWLTLKFSYTSAHGQCVGELDSFCQLIVIVNIGGRTGEMRK